MFSDIFCICSVRKYHLCFGTKLGLRPGYGELRIRAQYLANQASPRTKPLFIGCSSWRVADLSTIHFIAAPCMWQAQALLTAILDSSAIVAIRGLKAMTRIVDGSCHGAAPRRPPWFFRLCKVTSKRRATQLGGEMICFSLFWRSLTCR